MTYYKGENRRYVLTNNAISEEFSGDSLIDAIQNKGANVYTYISAHRTGSGGAYTVQLQQAIPAADSNEMNWEQQAQLTQSADMKAVHIVRGMRYRFRATNVASNAVSVDVRIAGC